MLLASAWAFHVNILSNSKVDTSQPLCLLGTEGLAYQLA